jgi:hypothetical protein
MADVQMFQAVQHPELYTLGLVAFRLLCAAKDETSVDIMGRMFCCHFLQKSQL